jgi:hypothetical protein
MLKCTSVVLCAFAYYQAIGSRLLGPVINQALRNLPEQAQARRFLLICVLLNMTFLDDYENGDSVISMVRGMLADRRVNHHHLYLLMEELTLIYHQSGLGDRNRAVIEELMADLNLAVEGVRRPSQTPFVRVQSTFERNRERVLRAMRTGMRQALDQ